MKKISFCWLSIVAYFFIGMLSTHYVYGESVRIYTNPHVSQYVFAAEEVMSALESRGIHAEITDIRDLSTDLRERIIVITDRRDIATANLYMEEVGEDFGHLGKQAFAMRTMLPAKSYWIFGGDVTGAMYGGLQLAEYILLNGADITIDEEQSPDIMNRGVKFNIPFDERSPTYYGSGFSEDDFRGTSTKKAVSHVWDIDFWAAKFDELARHRYNVFTIWSLHPFTSMIKMPDYPKAAIQDVQGFDGFFKPMPIDEKIEFWKTVMLLAKDRGIDFYIFNWNIYTYGATGKYDINNDPANPATIDYMRRCMTRLFETYPDLKGFGVTAGENMWPGIKRENAEWIWESYGKGLFDYASKHPERDVVFIHRHHDAGGAELSEIFKPLIDLPNVLFDFSFKYAVAHIYSTTTPDWIRTRLGDIPSQLRELNLKTWLTLRNDDFYFLHWGNPQFVREYLANFPDKDNIIQGFMMGSDGYTPTYVFTSKADWAQGKLDIQRQWYTWMLWGRLAYNPNIPDAYFQKILGNRYQGVESERLFDAWRYASKGVPLFTEMIQGTWISDFLWYPEACMSRRHGFLTIDKIAEAVPPPGSKLCSIEKSAANQCGDKKSAYTIADEIEMFANLALKELNGLEVSLDTEIGTNIGNIRALAYLSLYYAEKLRGATFVTASENDKAREAMGKAYHYWKSYSSLMHSMYTGMDFQRTNSLTNWLMLDEEVLKEYINLGGKPDVKR